MELKAFLILVLFLSGCMSEAEQVTDSTTSSTTSSTSSSSSSSTSLTSSTSTSTSTTLYFNPECEKLGNLVGEWQTRCLDDIAINSNDATLCDSIHCLAYLSGNSSLCSDDDKVCFALVEKNPLICNDEYHKSECKKEYSLLLNDIRLCERSVGDKRKSECYDEWAYRRADIEPCGKNRKSADVHRCEGRYWSRVGQEKQDKSFCEKIQNGFAKSLCIQEVSEAVKGGYTGNLLRLLNPSNSMQGTSNMLVLG